jgi:hypothetical protein
MTLSLWSIETYESPVGEDVRERLKGKKNEPEKKAKKRGPQARRKDGILERKAADADITKIYHLTRVKAKRR